MAQARNNDLWAVGVVIVLAGSLVSNFGVNLQKFSHLRAAAEAEKVAKKAYKTSPDKRNFGYCGRPEWVVGICLVVVGAVADFAALCFAPQSLLAPLGATTLVANVFFAHYWLGENVTKQDLLATLLVVCGAVATTFSSDHQPHHHSLMELEANVSSLSFGVYVLVLVLLIGLLLCVACRALRKSNVTGSTTSKLMPFCYASLSGIFGAQSVLCAKMIGELIKQSAMDDKADHIFTHPFPYIVIVVLVFFILVQTHLLNLGLKNYDAVLVFPIFQIFWILFSVLGGLIFFKEIQNLSTVQLLIFSFAVLFLIIGVFILAQHEMKEIVQHSAPSKFQTHAMAALFISKLRKRSLETKKRNKEPEPENHTIASLDRSAHKRSISFELLLLGAETAMINSNQLPSEETIQESSGTSSGEEQEDIDVQEVKVASIA